MNDLGEKHTGGVGSQSFHLVHCRFGLQEELSDDRTLGCTLYSPRPWRWKGRPISLLICRDPCHSEQILDVDEVVLSPESLEPLRSQLFLLKCNRLFNHRPDCRLIKLMPDKSDTIQGAVREVRAAVGLDHPPSNPGFLGQRRPQPPLEVRSRASLRPVRRPTELPGMSDVEPFGEGLPGGALVRQTKRPHGDPILRITEVREVSRAGPGGSRFPCRWTMELPDHFQIEGIIDHSERFAGCGGEIRAGRLWRSVCR